MKLISINYVCLFVWGVLLDEIYFWIHFNHLMLNVFERLIHLLEARRHTHTHTHTQFQILKRYTLSLGLERLARYELWMAMQRSGYPAS